jgi:hypothetical protein
VIRKIFVIVVATFISACASISPSLYLDWAGEPTPDYWSLGSSWAFAAIQEDGQIQRAITIRFTDTAAETCNTGDWKQVEIIAQSPERSEKFAGLAAYKLIGSTLRIDLTSNLCDTKSEYRGELTDTGFVGYQQSGGLAGETIGPVYGVRLTDLAQSHQP